MYHLNPLLYHTLAYKCYSLLQQLMKDEVIGIIVFEEQDRVQLSNVHDCWSRLIRIALIDERISVYASFRQHTRHTTLVSLGSGEWTTLIEMEPPSPSLWCQITGKLALPKTTTGASLNQSAPWGTVVHIFHSL